VAEVIALPTRISARRLVPSARIVSNFINVSIFKYKNADTLIQISHPVEDARWFCGAFPIDDAANPFPAGTRHVKFPHLYEVILSQKLFFWKVPCAVSLKDHDPGLPGFGVSLPGPR
jgi:hypothetical protein